MSKSWGEPLWYFFHSFSEHISEECYEKNKEEICTILKTICANLPCDDCTKHAKQYTRYSLNPKNVPTKQALKDYFFTFHNSVNVRLRKPIFNDYDKYKNAKLRPIINNFIHVYGRNSNPIRGFHNTLSRNQIINTIKNFILRHKTSFTWL